MSNDTLTLALNGDVPLQYYANAMRNFYALLQSIAAEVAPKARVEWVIESLESGSAIATVRAVADSIEVIPYILNAYMDVGKALHTNAPIPFSIKVSKPALALTQLLNGNITSLRFETSDKDIIISSHYAEEGDKHSQPTYAVGTIKGIVETLSRRRGLRFTMYDPIFDRAIAGYLKEGEEGKIKDFWGKKVLVSGLIGRDAESGKPFAIREISTIQLAEGSEPGSYKRARGVLKLRADETPEGLIRAVRDG